MDSSVAKRHVGYIKSTGSPVVVVAMENPRHPGHALVIQTDVLPDQFHEYLMDAVQSSAGQDTIEFHKFLERRSSPDNGINMLESFARRNMIREEPTNNVILTPLTGQRYPLNEVLDTLKGKAPQTKSGTTEINNQADSFEEKTALANNLLSQAELLISEANRKKEEAYRVAPHLRPNQSKDDLVFFNNKIQKSKIEECYEGDTCSLDNDTPVKTTLPDLSNELGLNVDPSGTVNVTIPESRYPF